MPGAGPLTLSLALADRVFRLAGRVTLALLLVTLALRVTGAEYWAVIFGLAHLAALVALLPLGVALLRHGFRRAAAEGDPGPGGVLRRYRGVALILAGIAVAVTVTLLNFEDGIRWLRRVANFTTVALVLVLVGRYLRWARSLRGIGSRPDRMV